ncbi:MAG TPA: hypothetical protein PKE63_13175 [Lacibacter sp.]|nr:hypothetical protein [Lacibacter sp.]HMO89369.1 hypothetical protein [Lacibacter sp.]HMP88225.1 hypothetical protein [Lacibacter sp.]
MKIHVVCFTGIPVTKCLPLLPELNYGGQHGFAVAKIAIHGKAFTGKKMTSISRLFQPAHSDRERL